MMRTLLEGADEPPFFRKLLLLVLLLPFGEEGSAQQTQPDTLPRPDSVRVMRRDTMPDSLRKPIRPDSLPKRDSARVVRKDSLPQPARPDSARKSQTGNWLPKEDSIRLPAQQPPASRDSVPGTGQLVQGRVLDEKGSGLPGVAVTVKNTQTVTVTTPDGAFRVRVPDNRSLLTFSFTGYKPKEQLVGNMRNLTVTLEPDVKVLNEVVVVGYGTQSRKDLASATSRVAASEIKTAVINTVDQALQGRTTGVQVVETSGEPGAAAVVRIRGNNSLSGNNEPLYVIDGFPMPPYREAAANFTGAYSQNGLYGINPNDIESMEVLKDASATAIYGSRGANGVVLITTKSGKRGEGRVELVNRTSFGQISNPIKMMNGPQYAEIINENYRLTNRKPPFETPPTTSTDWVKAITQPSFRQDLTFGVSGGSPKSSYYLSGNYLHERGTIIRSDNNRGSLRANFNSDVNDWYTVKAQLSFTRQQSNRAITTSKAWPSSGGLMDGLRAVPTVAKDYAGYNSLGIPGYSGYYFSNPYLELTSKTDLSKNDYSILNIENWFRLVKGLQLVVSGGTNQNLTRRQVFMPPVTAEGLGPNGSGSSAVANTYSYNANAYFLYEHTFQKNHYLNATLGGEYNSQTLEQLTTISSGYDVPAFGVDNIGSAHIQSIGSYKESRTIQSAFARLNYTFKGRYVLNTSLRLDGASPFAANKKYALFPAVGVAWNVDAEEFMKKVKFLSNLKLRASYGETGSQAINPYASLSQFWNGFYQLGTDGKPVTSLYPTTLGNPNLSWERTSQFNAGVDFNLANDKLVVSFDYYRKLTSGLLQQRILPSQSGVSSILDNYGTMENRGLELSVQFNVLRKKDLTFSSRLSVSRNVNILRDLGDRTTPDYINISGNLLGGTSGILVPGEEVGQFFGYKIIGLAQTKDFDAEGKPLYPSPGVAEQIPGAWKYEDKNGDGQINADDRQVLGKSTPDFVFGWTNDFTWKRFTISAFITGSVGNDVLNLTRFYLTDGLVDYAGVSFNQTEEWYRKRWTASRPHNDPRFPGTQIGIPTGDINSVILEDGTFVRLKMLTLAYQLPKLGPVKNPRLFLTGTNLFTLTNYTGFDPEVSSYNQSLLQQGIDYGAYPAQKSFTIGFSCNF